MNNNTVLPFVLVFPVFFVALWCGIIYLISQISGWALLARRFRSTSPFTGPTWRWQSCRMRWSSHYGNCLTVGSDPTGLFLDILFLFRIGHPPLLIPWAEVSVRRRSQILFWSYVDLRLGREEQVPLQISAKLADRLRTPTGVNWPLEPVA